jgi:Holliday junction DNA helicase RuvB
MVSYHLFLICIRIGAVQLLKEFIESSWAKQDTVFEAPLRPQVFSDFIGQDALRQRLEILIRAAKMRKEPIGHCLFSGPPGLGKTTLAYIVADSMGTNLITTSGPALEKAGDLAGILSNLKSGDIFFIDEIHRLARNIEEYLYVAIEEFRLDIVIDSGPAARTVRIDLAPFTLVGATTQSGLISGPMRSRFLFSGRFDYYPIPLLREIIKRSATILKMPISEEGAYEIAGRARGTPRIANNLLRFVRDYAQIRNQHIIDRTATLEALQLLAIDSLGLDELDKRILEVLIDHNDGKPVGLSTLAVAVGEEPDTIATVCEPFLIMLGLVRRTPSGREATAKARRHLGREE